MPLPRSYPTEVSDEEWAFAAPYLSLMSEQAPQRKYELRVMFNGLRWMARSGAPWRLLPNDFPPWEAVYQQTQRWLRAGCFEAMVEDLRSILRMAQGHAGQPSAAIFDGRTLQSTCESGPRAGYDGERQQSAHGGGLARLPAGRASDAANEQERAQAGSLAQEVQRVTGENVKVAFVDQGYTGEEAATAARNEGIELQVVKLPEAKKGFVLLPWRWVVERNFGWINRFCRLARDYERLPETLAGLHFVVFAILMLGNAARILPSS